MLDDIREWISDNLRYILLGLAGIVVIFLLVTVIRAVSGGSSKSSKKENKAESSQTSTTESATPESGTAEASSTGDGAQTSGDGIQETADENLITLVKSYYQALAAQDVETIRVLTDQLTADDQAKIESENDIESYSDIKVYTAKGPQDGTYVVYAAYNFKYKNFATLLPGLSRLYICTASDGSYYISNGAMTEAVKDYIEAENASSGVADLIQTTKTAYDTALAADASLSGYLNNKGENASNALYQADGTELTIKQNCNVRAEASTSSTKLGQLAAGAKVTKTGAEAEWVKIDYNGQTAYVRWDMFK